MAFIAAALSAALAVAAVLRNRRSGAVWWFALGMIGLAELGPDPRYSTMAERFLHAEELNGIIKTALMHCTALEWFEKGIELRLPLAIVPDMRELLTQQVHHERGAFAKVEIGDASFDAPLLPQRLARSPPKPNGRAPFAGTVTPVEVALPLRLSAVALTPADLQTFLKGRLDEAGPPLPEAELKEYAEKAVHKLAELAKGLDACLHD